MKSIGVAGAGTMGVPAFLSEQTTAAQTPPDAIDKNVQITSDDGGPYDPYELHQGSALVYFGSDWNDTYGHWEHDFRFATTGRGIKGNDESYAPDIIRKQHYNIETDSIGVTVNLGTADRYHGVRPAQSENSVVEKFAEEVIKYYTGGLSDALDVWLKADTLASGLGKPDHPLSLPIELTHETWWGMGVPKADHFQQFTLEQEICDPSSLCTDESEATVTTGIEADPSNSRKYTTGVEYIPTVWPSDDEGRTWSNGPSIQEVSQFSSLDPTEMTQSERDMLGIKKVPVKNVSPRRQRMASSNDNHIYHATNIPVSIEAKQIE